ncbi:hypothetical protein F4802DRAFT_299729 [Xylaria palmicola]|nr:hypothetical protein F4802DRAFT_299729 [Xylaria palmicola]
MLDPHACMHAHGEWVYRTSMEVFWNNQKIPNPCARGPAEPFAFSFDLFFFFWSPPLLLPLLSSPLPPLSLLRLLRLLLLLLLLLAASISAILVPCPPQTPDTHLRGTFRIAGIPPTHSETRFLVSLLVRSR